MSNDTRPCPNVIIQGDVSAYLKGLEDDCVDLVIADPGYGMGKADWDRRPEFGQWVEETLRVLKPTGTAYIFGLPEAVASYWDSFPAPKRLLTWHVTNRVSPKCKTWQPTQESIVMLTKGEPYFDRDAVREPYGAAYERIKGRPRPQTPSRFGSQPTLYSDASGALPRDVLRGPGLSGKVGARESLGHPCQKPLWLLERLIKASCPPDSLCLDLFSGVATTSAAAHRLGRQWVAVEKDPRWCQVALERLQKEGAAATTVSSLSSLASTEMPDWAAAMQSQLAALQAAVEGLQAQNVSS